MARPHVVLGVPEDASLDALRAAGYTVHLA